MNAAFVVALACSSVVVAGCYSTTVSGAAGQDGGRDVVVVTCDAATGADASDAGSADAADAAPVPVFTLDAGTTWTALYRDYFGPTGVASCAGDGACHGDTSQPGYLVSRYLCPTGNEPAKCYAGMTSTGDGGANLIVPDASFSDDLISQILCQDDGTGIMPLYCSYYFTTVDMQRIADWVAAGAKDN